MKTKYHKRHGFALVATLTLMMLLGLIAVGLLAVSSSQNRIAAQTILQAEARQQALIGLDAAISDLQFEAGPDQRVTASSGILSENKSDPQYVLGVWDSWQAPLYGRHKGGDIQRTYTAGRASMFRRWLISCSDPRQQQQFNSVRELSTQKPGYRICMIGEGTLGTDASKDEYVYAELITMPSANRNETCYAWWVGGENQKANVAIADRPRTDDPVEILHRTWDTPAPVFRDSKNLDFLPEDIQDPQKMLDLKSLPLVNRGATDVGQPYFFDATTYSYSLITNARDGGLKLDLNLLLNKEERDFNRTPMAPRSDQDCPLAEGEGLPTGTEASFPIGSWQVMHTFYNLWPDGTGVMGEDFSSPRLAGGVEGAYTRMGGHLESKTTAKGDDVTFFDERARLSENQHSGYARTPILLSFYGTYGLLMDDPQGTHPGHSHGLAYAPFFLWWNPYNVPLRVGAKKLWAHSLLYRTNSVLWWAPAKATGSQYENGSDYFWGRYLMLQTLQVQQVDKAALTGQRNVFADDWGNYFVHSESDQSSDIVFEPGEILMFSMAEGFNNLELLNSGEDENGTSYSQPQGIPFVQGDQVGILHNYFSSQFSSGDRTSYVMKLALETQSGYSSSGYIQTQLSQEAQYVSGGQVYDTIGDYVGPKSRGMMAVTHGFNGVDASQAAGQSAADSRLTSRLDRFIGAEGISPYTFNLGWYDYDTTSIEDVTFVSDMSWNLSMYKEPYYYAAVGIAPKSYNPMLSSALPGFSDRDYRTKNWVHSSPAMGGGTLYKPDDQQRQYHPFQLSAIEVDARRVMDTVNSKNGIYGIQSIGTGGGEAVSFISVLELPVHPPFSLAGFSGMRLKPGWYNCSGDGRLNTLANMRRMQYQAGVPGVGIGNSFADPCLPADGVYVFHQTEISSDGLERNGNVFSDFYDHGFIINDALWDRWFCSSVSDMPGGRGRVQARDTLEAFVQGEQSLPVSRYKLAHTSVQQSQIVSRIMSGDGWKEIARYLMVEGGFNVNSVSEDAWAAVLQGLAKRELVSNTDNHLHAVEHRGGDNVLFSRFMVSTADRTFDSSGSGYNMLLGAAFLRPSMKMATAWGDVRSLSSDQIRELAREMVKKVRERGPFLNMADFINRRLDGGTEAALTGALQAAIDATDINKDFTRSDFMVHPLEGGLYSFPRAEEGSMYTAAPGYLIQSDVLMSLGNILTVRDDTFTVRAYGCVRNARRAILAQAWCEAIVQRTIEYVDPTNSPTEGGYDPANQGTSGGNQSKLSEVNRLMGRKMRVVSFKWLDSWDI